MTIAAPTEMFSQQKQVEELIRSLDTYSLHSLEPVSDASTVSTFEQEEYKRLHDILASPEQLAYFQIYLQNIHAHENLLFIEALSELRHEKISKNIESIVHRIWKTFLALGAPLELNVKNKESVVYYIESHKYAIFSKVQALNIFKDIEIEVKIFLNEKIVEFDKTYKTLNRVFHEPTCSKHQKKVVIVGGGFTGFTVASILDPMPRFHVTLIDTKDSFEYTPGMIKLLVRPEDTSSLRVRHDAYVKNGRVIIGYAEQVVNDARSIKVNNEYVPLDYLVIATGSTYTSKLKSFDTSSLYRLSELTTEHNELKKARSVLIIGGGLVGCELASEIATHEYPPPYHNKKKITIVDPHSNLVRRSTGKRQANAFDYLTGLGVEIILNEKIVDFDSSDTNSYLGSSGACYTGYDKVFVATGTTPCSDIFQGDGDVGFESCVDHWGRLRVKPTLQLEHWKYKHIFAGGDVSNIKEEKTGYAATLAGVCIARNICRMEKNKHPLDQGSKGTLPAPSQPLHGIKSQGGVGRKHLSNFKKTFAFLNPTWAALKYFDEKEFLNIVQGEAKLSTTAIGKKPSRLNLNVPDTFYKNTSCSNSTYSVSSIFKQQTNLQQNHIKKGTAESLFSLASSTSDAHLHVSATNLSGSDIVTNTNESRDATVAALSCSCSTKHLKRHNIGAIRDVSATDLSLDI
ncbi:hypothetical protein BDF21DRAFT_361696 [Thamnidium elegans]|nr:hypothetical protein BDF21DRAFT_361696 [Thamnidium elegans]